MTASKMLPTLARVNELLSYSPETGEFRWRVRRNQHAKVGDQAGSRRPDGYHLIQIDGRNYLAHRLAWFVTHNLWPPDQIDHIDGDPSNNRIDNLRPATHAENGKNIKIKSSNTSGYSGVYFHNRDQKWCVQITVNYKRIHLGYFDTIEEAVAVRQAAEIKYFKEFRKIVQP